MRQAVLFRLPQLALLGVLAIAFAAVAQVPIKTDRTAEIRRLVGQLHEANLQLDKNEAVKSDPAKRTTYEQRKKRLLLEMESLKPDVEVLVFGEKNAEGGFPKLTYADAEHAGYKLRYHDEVRQYFALKSDSRVAEYQVLTNREAVQALVRECVGHLQAKGLPKYVSVPKSKAMIAVMRQRDDATSLQAPVKTCAYRLTATPDYKIKLETKIYVDYQPDEQQAVLQPRLQQAHAYMVQFFARYNIILQLTFLHDTGDIARANADGEITFRKKGRRGIYPVAAERRGGFNYSEWALQIGNEISLYPPFYTQPNYRTLTAKDRDWTYLHEYLHHFGLQEEYKIAGQVRPSAYEADSIMRNHYESEYRDIPYREPALYRRHVRKIIAPLCNPHGGNAITVVVQAAANSSSETGKAKDTGLDVQKGGLLRITATGTWSAGSNQPNSRQSDADGILEHYGKWTQFGLTAPYGALVAQIGDGPYFLVGKNYTGTAENSGRLKLHYWDSNSNDNTGKVTARVSARPAPDSNLIWE